MRLAQSSEEIFKLKFRLGDAALDNPLQIRRIRRDIARIKTLIREREISGIAPSAPMTRDRARAEDEDEGQGESEVEDEGCGEDEGSEGKGEGEGREQDEEGRKATKKASAARRSK